MLKTLLTAVLLMMVAFSHAQAPAQTRADLEKERAAIQKEIEDVKRSLDETHKNKRETLGQLALLQRRLKLRQSAIRNINQQINVIQGDMNESWREILKLRRLSARRLRRTRPGVTDAEVDADVERRMETGEFEALRRG